MRVAQVVSGVVVNIVEVDPNNRPDFAKNWPEAQEAGPGWGYRNGAFSAPSAQVTSDMITAERNSRMSGTFVFRGQQYDCDPDSMARITGAATLAGFAIANGAQPGNLRWMDQGADFVWIAHDNTMTPMDAHTMFAFGQAAATNHAAHVFAARALKDTSPIPADFADDKYWP